MKILLCHNYYQQPGGEDQVFADECRLLEQHGHHVVRFERHNNTIDYMSQPALALRTVWNHRIYREVRELIRHERPHVMHCTNTFPLLSPAVYYAARREGVAVVQSLHNYRTICPTATFFRDGRICEKCLSKAVPWPSVVHGCYQHGRASNAVVTTMLSVHRAMRTWHRTVDQYIALSEFARGVFVRGGLPAAKIVVKPNSVDPDPGPGAGYGGYVVFVGRLSREKGVHVLLEAWSRLPTTRGLKIIGDGPLATQVGAAAARDTRIEWLGRQPMNRVLDIVGAAGCLVLPSITYEMLPKTIIEAFARATPVVASDHGGMADLVERGRTGELFRPGDADALAEAITRIFANGNGLLDMRRAARSAFERGYTSRQAYERLLLAYEQALAVRSHSSGPSPEAVEGYPRTPGDGSRPEQDELGLKGSTTG